MDKATAAKIAELEYRIAQLEKAPGSPRLHPTGVAHTTKAGEHHFTVTLRNSGGSDALRFVAHKALIVVLNGAGKASKAVIVSGNPESKPVDIRTDAETGFALLPLKTEALEVPAKAVVEVARVQGTYAQVGFPDGEALPVEYSFEDKRREAAWELRVNPWRSSTNEKLTARMWRELKRT